MSPKSSEDPPHITQVATFEELRRVLLGKPSPLQRVIAFSTATPGNPNDSAQQTLDRLFDTPLANIALCIADMYAVRPGLPQEEVAEIISGLDQFRRGLGRPLREVAGEEMRFLVPGLLDLILGQMTLRECYGADRVKREQWESLMVEARLLRKAIQGDRNAFDSLYARHQRQVFGFIRGRARNDADAEDIAQEAALKIWQKMPTYDPARAPFAAFAKYWSGFMLLQYYSTKKTRDPRVEVLFSELVWRFPDLEGEGELAGLIDRLSQPRFRTEERVPPEVYEELLRLTFGCTSPPHQKIVFGFVKPLKWKPRQVVAKLSDIPLRELALRLERDYLAASSLPEDRVKPLMRPLHDDMNRPFEDVVGDQKTLKTHPRLIGRIVGDLSLGDHYTGTTKKSQAQNVAHWWFAVRRLVRGKVKEQGKGLLFELLYG